MSVRGLLIPALLLAAPSSATAADYYVDAVNGSNANAGTSPSSPWLTISHALATVPAPGAGETHTIHVAPGVYDPALGETGHPLRHQFAVVGDQGSEVTFVSPGFFVPATGAPVLVSSRVEGLTIQNGGVFLGVLLWGGASYVNMKDVAIEGSGGAGISGTIPFNAPLGTGIGATLRGVRIRGCGSGISLIDDWAHDSVNLTAVDCEVADNAGAGIFFVRGGSSSETFSLKRCRIVGNGGRGVEKLSSSGASGNTPIMEACLIAGNHGDGLRGEGASAGAGGVTVRACTIARNGGAGVQVASASGFYALLDGSIVHGNVDDVLDPYGNVTARFSEIGDGDFAGANGNFSAEPLFRDAAAGDYRLAWGSPCIESGDPAAAPGTLDLVGTKRPVDGDLDTQELIDVGAFEFIPLGIASAAHVGQNLVLELWGQSGGSAISYLGRNFPQLIPLSTPFGDFELDPSAFRDLGSSPIAPGPPAQRLIPIPNSSNYIGLTFSFQALSRSGVAPLGAAYTNPVTITILP